MTNAVDNALSKGTFDLRAVLSERQYPEDVATFYVDEELGYAVERINDTLNRLTNQLAVAKLGDNKKKIAEAEKAIKAAEAKLEETHQAVTPYKATIRSISRRAKFDIQSKALSKYPIKRDIYGNDDPQQEFDRNHYMDILIWTTHLKSIQGPDGGVQNFNGYDDQEVISGIMDALPESAYRAINSVIDRLMDDGARFEFAAQDEDFSSES